MRPGRSRQVLSETLLRLIVDNPDTVVDAKAGMSPAQQISREIFFQQTAVHQHREVFAKRTGPLPPCFAPPALDDTPTEHLDHGI